MEADPAVSDWIKLEDEAEAMKARARMIRRVAAVMDPLLINSTKASAYHKALCLSLPPTSPVSHAGIAHLIHHSSLPEPVHPLTLPHWALDGTQRRQWIAVRMLHEVQTARPTHPLQISARYSPNIARR